MPEVCGVLVRELKGEDKKSPNTVFQISKINKKQKTTKACGREKREPPRDTTQMKEKEERDQTGAHGITPPNSLQKKNRC